MRITRTLHLTQIFLNKIFVNPTNGNTVLFLHFYSNFNFKHSRVWLTSPVSFQTERRNYRNSSASSRYVLESLSSEFFGQTLACRQTLSLVWIATSSSEPTSFDKYNREDPRYLARKVSYLKVIVYSHSTAGSNSFNMRPSPLGEGTPIQFRWGVSLGSRKSYPLLN